MSPSRCVSFFPFLLLLAAVFGSAAASGDEYVQIICDFKANVSSSSQVAVNIRKFLPVLISEAESNGYFAGSYGQNKSKVYGLAYCRGDVGRKDCRTCLQRSVSRATKTCPNVPDVRNWYSYCFLRYKTEKFIGKLDTGLGISDFTNKNLVSNPDTFYNQLYALTNRTKSLALKSERLFATAESKISSNTTLYALVQCSLDLSKASCGKCVNFAVQMFRVICENASGCFNTYGYCYVQYGPTRFFFPHDEGKLA